MPPAITELLKVPGLGPKRVKALLARPRRADPRAGAARCPRRTHSQPSRLRREDRAQHRAGRRRAICPRSTASSSASPRNTPTRSSRTSRRSRASAGWPSPAATGACATPSAISTFSSPAARRPRNHRSLRRAIPTSTETLPHGATRASVRLRGGLQVDLRVVPAASFGAALVYFTGSKAHNIALRRLGQERGLKINEYGVFRDRSGSPATPRNRSTARSVCRSFRRSCAKIAARSTRRATGRLPELVELRRPQGRPARAHERDRRRNTLEDMVGRRGRWASSTSRSPSTRAGRRCRTVSIPQRLVRPRSGDRPVERAAARYSRAARHRGRHPRRRRARPARRVPSRDSTSSSPPCTASST